MRCSSAILTMADEFKMIRVHTSSDTAEMIDFEILGDRAVSLDPRIPMSGVDSVSADHSIAIYATPKPDPAGTCIAAIFRLPAFIEGLATARHGSKITTRYPIEGGILGT